MADTKISALTSATTPLAGTEVTVIVQSGATVKVPVSQLGGGTKTIARWTPDRNQPPASGFATFDTRNGILVLDFDDAATESAVFADVIPEGASLGSGILVRVGFAATSATSGSVRLRAEFERGTTDLDTDSFDTATEATVATNATSGVLTWGEITCTNIDSIVAGDYFRCRISRVGSDGGDTMSGDMELLAVELRQVA